MSLRMPKDLTRLTRAGRPADDLSALEVETMAESAGSLGHHGRKAEAALLRLRDAEGAARRDVLAEAADAVWAYFVQRELCGMRNHRLIIREMAIPTEVLNRLGSTAPRKD